MAPQAKKIQGTSISQRHPWFNHGSTRRGKNAGEKIESALIWGRHLQKGLVKKVSVFFSPPDFSVFFFFFENQFLEKLVFKTSFFNHPNTLDNIKPTYITHSPKLRITCDQPWSQFKVTIFSLKKFSDPGIFSDRSGNAIPRLFAKKYCTLRSLNVCVS